MHIHVMLTGGGMTDGQETTHSFYVHGSTPSEISRKIAREVSDFLKLCEKSAARVADRHSKA